MAKTAAEYQRAYRERKAQEAKLAGDPSDRIVARTFDQYVRENEDSFLSEVHYPLEWAGINPDHLPRFEANDDPEYDAETDGPNRDAIGRAERMVSMYLSAGRGLANFINHYKREEITNRIHEIENSDLSDADARKKALADIVRLKKMLDQLDKQVRWTFPQWEVTGE